MERGLLSNLVHLLYPRLCAVCHRQLSGSESSLCLHCIEALPYSHYFTDRTTPILRDFMGYSNVVSATALLQYEGEVKRLIHELKYYGNEELGRTLGRMAGRRLKAVGHAVCAAEVIIPIPIHRRRERARGYNQSVSIAEGLSSILELPIAPRALARTVHTSSQTIQSIGQRYQSLSEAFRIVSPESIGGYKHILLVDDVITTESTFAACSELFAPYREISLSLFAVAKTGEL
jgi:ComF family protein